MENLELNPQDETLSDQEDEVNNNQKVVEPTVSEVQSQDLTLVETGEKEVVEKKTRTRKYQTSSEEVFNVGDRVTVVEDKDLTWSDGRQVPRWIRTRRFYILSTSDNGEYEIGLNLSGKVSGKISAKFLKRFK